MPIGGLEIVRIYQTGLYTYEIRYLDIETGLELKDRFTENDDIGSFGRPKYRITEEDYVEIVGYEKADTEYPPYERQPGSRTFVAKLRYKKKEYSLTFVTKEGENIEYENIKYQNDISGNKTYNDYIIGETEHAKEEGYIFGGWYDNPSYVGDPVTLTTMPAYNLMLYAKWIAPEHQVRVHKEMPHDSDFESITVNHKDSLANMGYGHDSFHDILIPPVGSTSDDFLGFYWNEPGTFMKFDFATPIFENIDIYPVWKTQVVNVKYYDGGVDQQLDDDQLYPLNSVAIIKNPRAKEKDNQVFVGWKLENSEKIYYPNEPITLDNTTVTSDDSGNNIVKLVAVWEDKDAVTKIIYNANFGDPPQTQEVSSIPNNGEHEVSGPLFQRPGYEFLGWSKHSGENNEVEYHAGNTIRLDKEDEATANVLYAVWKKIKRQVDATKIWKNGPETHPTVWFKLYRQIEGGEAKAVPEVEIQELANGTTEVTWTGLDKTDDDGKEYIYFVREVNASGEDFVPTNYTKSEDGLTVTNTYNIPQDGKATATKVWKNGPETHPTVWFKLYRQIEGGEAEAVPGAEIKELTDGTTEVNWTGLDKTDLNGKAYIFSVKEVDENGNDYTPEHYTKAENGLKATNTYVIPQDGKATATKVWKNGPETHPTVWFKLYRQIEGGEAKAVPGAEIKKLTDGTTEVNWTGLDKTDLNGKAYTFSVKEVDADGKDFVPTNYIKSEDGLTVTNTYESPKNGKATATKTWVNGPEPRPTVWFKLYRNVEGGTIEEVPESEAPIKELASGTEEVTWTDLTENDQNGKPYTFTVKEVNKNGDDWTPANYEKTENGLTVINTYKSPANGEAKATKVWVGGPTPRPTVWFKLYRNVENGDVEEVPVSEAPIKELASGTEEVTWTDLTENDQNGKPYTFSVKEVNADGENFTPKYYVKVEEGLTVTNTYESPKNGKATATKTWVNGPAPRPTVWFKLYRNVEGGDVEEVPVSEAPIKELASGTTEVTWTKLTENDQNGKPYTFTVKEVNENGGDWTPTNYEKTENGLTVTNTYKIPKIAVKATKIWENGSTTRPTVRFKLYRSIIKNDPNPDAVADIKVLVSGEEEVIWEGMDKTDSDGNLYYYSVKEVDKNGDDWEPENYQKTESGLTVTNTYEIPKEDVTADKIWVNGPSEHPTVKFQLMRQKDGGQLEAVPDEEIKELPNGTTSVTWTGIDRTDANGNEFTFSVIEVEIPENYQKTESGLTVTNTYEIPKNGKATATKVWVDGPDTHPTVWFKLYRNIEGGAVEEVPETEAPIKELASGTTKVTWTGLDETDLAGNEYTFSVKEVNASGEDFVPTNYTKSEEGLTVTNTYVSPEKNVKATKEWVNGPDTHPTVWFKLYRSTIKDDPNPNEVAVLVKSLSNENLSVSWFGLDETDSNGKLYYYSVKEVDADGNEWTPDHYEKTENGLTVTNTYVIPKNGKATATKVWVDGPDTHPTVWFKLYRNIEGGAVEEVPETEAPIKELASGTTKVTWTGLEKTDLAGNEYTFSVKEVNDQGKDFTPENYTKEEEGLKVTNTYKSPTDGEATATKTWVKGPDTHPTIYLKLYRNVKGGTVEEVPVNEAPIKKLAQENTEVTWYNLTKTDSKGNPYIFTVKEVNAEGQETTPPGYTQQVNGLHVTNTYSATANVTIKGNKALDGRTLKNNDFSFKLTPCDETGKILEGAESETVTNTGKTFQFATKTYYDVGTHRYLVEEVSGDEKGMTYDETKYIVTVVLTDSGDGKLTPTVTYQKIGSTEPVEGIKFTNTYEAKGEWIPKFTKILDGRDFEEGDEFNFEIKYGDDVIRTTTNNGEDIVFDKITYNQGDIGKTFTYVVYEKAMDDPKPGLTYSQKTITVIVKVGDAGGGKLDVNISTKPANTSLDFTNVYTKDASTPIQVGKILEGRNLKDKEFSFTLYDGETELKTVKNDADGVVNFGNYQFNLDPGKDEDTVVYTIEENIPKDKEDGMTYDPGTITVTIKVERHNKGQADEYITATPTYAKDNANPDEPKNKFKNKYAASTTWDASAALGALKQLTGRELKANEFGFTLEKRDDNGKYQVVESDIKNNTDGTIAVQNITYTQADIGKTFYYKITEDIPAENDREPGMTYDEGEILFKVEVTDAGGGHLVITPTITSEKKTFNNIYEASGEWDPSQIDANTRLKKVLDGRELKLNEFSFTMSQVQVEGQEVPVKLKEPMTVKNDSQGNIDFGKIEFNQDDVGKTFTFEIKENVPAEADQETDMTYDQEAITVTVTVTDAGGGKLNIAANYSKTKFTNTYKASGEWDPSQITASTRLKKVLNGRELKLNEFSFTMSQVQVEGQEVPVKLKEPMKAKNDSQGNIDFGSKIEFNQDDIGKTFTFEIKENVPAEADRETGMTYDTKIIEVKLKVTDAGGGALAFNATYKDKETGKEKTQFTNIYKASGQWDPQKVDASTTVKKKLQGRALVENAFEFKLEQLEGPKKAKASQIVGNKADGSIVFEPIEFDQDDVGQEFKFLITEIVPDPQEAGMKYDEKGIRVTLNVAHNENGNGALKITTTYLDNEGNPKTSFDNTYKASGEWDPLQIAANTRLKKVLNGRELKLNEFSFTMSQVQVEGQEVPVKLKEPMKVKNDSQGNIDFSKIEFNQDDVGKTFTFEIKEDIPENKEEGMTYDDKIIEVKLKVKDAGGGKLAFEADYHLKGEKETPKQAFNNSYKADGEWDPSQIAANTRLKKVLNGRELKLNEFSFTMSQVQVEGQEVPVKLEKPMKAKNDSQGNIDFGTKIKFNQDDIGKTFTFEIKEVIPENKEENMTYDDKVIEVKLNVTDAGGGNLAFNATYKEQGAEKEKTQFTNTYKASGEWDPHEGTATGALEKVLEGRELKAKDFEFELKQVRVDEEKTKIAKPITVKNGTPTDPEKTTAPIEFEAIKFDQDDIDQTFKFEIKEVIPKEPENGMTYDTKIIVVELKVTDAGGGDLAFNATYKDKATGKKETQFTNTYKASGEWNPHEGTVASALGKVLKGRELKAEDFEFELKQVKVNKEKIKIAKPISVKNGAPTDPKKTTAPIEFEAIPFDQDDINQTFKFEIREVIPEEPENGMTYDDKAIEVELKVTDAGNGALTFDATYKEQGAEKEKTQFTNSYKASGEWDPDKVTAQVDLLKVLVGRELKAEEFEFELKQVKVNKEKMKIAEPILVTNGTPIEPEKTKAPIDFAALTFDQDDIDQIFKFEIREVIPEEPETDMTYDDEVIEVIVKVTDAGNGKLKIDTDYHLKGEEETPKQVFNNSYKAEGDWDPSVIDAEAGAKLKKVLDGRKLKADEFTFTMTQIVAEGEEELEGLNQTVKNKADGTIPFAGHTFTQDDIGKTFTFEIKEDIPENKEKDMTYDEKVIELTLEIADAGDGQLKFITTYKEKGTDEDKTEFKNVYSKPHTPPGGDDEPDKPVVPTIPDIPHRFPVYPHYHQSPETKIDHAKAPGEVVTKIPATGEAIDYAPGIIALVLLAVALVLKRKIR